jgi:hypothetical protein
MVAQRTHFLLIALAPILAGYLVSNASVRSRPRYRSLFVLLTAASLMMSSGALAGTFTVFGPTTFERGNGEPVTIAEAFSVLNPNTSYFIKIHNAGLADDEFEKVASSIISLNGAQIVGPKEFNQTVGLVEQPINVGVDNAITVEVRGKPGGALVIEIFGIDNDPPVTTAAVSPEPNANGWHRADATVSFTCSDAISGVASCPEPVALSAEGANQTITGTAVDNAGNTAAASITINLDRTPPNIVRSWPPADAFGTDRGTVPVEGALSDGPSGVGSADLMGPLGNFPLGTSDFAAVADVLTAISADERSVESSFTIAAIDLAGNTATHEFRVVYTQSSTMVSSNIAETEEINGIPTSVNRALVQFGPDVSRNRIHEVIEGENGRVAGILVSTNMALAQFETLQVADLEIILDALEATSDVVLATPVFFLKKNVFDNDLLPEEQISLGRYPAAAYDHIRLSAAADFVNDNNLAVNPVAITIIDTGLDTAAGLNNELADIRYFDICTPEGQLGQESDPQDDDPDAHGTRVAGIVAGANNGQGNNGVIRGILGAQFTVNVLRAGDCGFSQDQIDSGMVNTGFDAIILGLIGKTDVVSMSYGNAIAVDDARREEFRNDGISFFDAGRGAQILWAFAVGNGRDLDGDGFNDKIQIDCNGDYFTWPASLSCDFGNVVAVGGHSVRLGQGIPGNFSGENLFNFGTAVTISAPGDLVWTATPSTFTNRYSFFGGTSAATPLVGGAAALLLSTKRFFPATVKRLLTESAQQLDNVGAPPQGGLDVSNLIQAGQNEPEAVNHALQFDGVDDLVRIPHDPNLSLTQFTIEAWVLVNDDQNFIRRPFVVKGAEFGNYALGVLGADTEELPGTVEYVQRTIDGNFSLGPPAEISFGVWHHVAATNSGTGTVSLYVDGNLLKTHTAVPVPLTNTEALHIGATNFQGIGFQFHKGLIDEVRIWNIARTQQQIADNFKKIIAPTTPGLVAYWMFDETAGDQSVVDQTGINNGTLGATNAISADDPVRVPSTAPVN